MTQLETPGKIIFYKYIYEIYNMYIFHIYISHIYFIIDEILIHYLAYQ